MTTGQKEFRKLLSANDLGLTGAHQGGITIPKNSDLIGFFPPLDPSVYNPDFWIDATTPQTGEHWALRFIYYNSKVHHQGTRNEFRLTHTTRMMRALSASPGDTLAFRRNALGDVQVFLHKAEDAAPPAPTETVLRNGWRMIIVDAEV